MKGLHNRHMHRTPPGWYPVSRFGVVVTTLYALVPPYIAYARTNNTFPDELRWPLVGVMGFVVVALLLCRVTGAKPFLRKKKRA